MDTGRQQKLRLHVASCGNNETVDFSLQICQIRICFQSYFLFRFRCIFCKSWLKLPCKWYIFKITTELSLLLSQLISVVLVGQLLKKISQSIIYRSAASFLSCDIPFGCLTICRLCTLIPFDAELPNLAG